MAELSAALEFFPLSSVAKVALTIEIRNRDSNRDLNVNLMAEPSR